MPYNDLLDSDQRLVILRHLEENTGTANDSVLQKVLNRWGHKISRDKTKTHLHWLKEQGLVTIEPVMNTDVATITSRGHDVANGCVEVPGVGLPRSGA